MSDERPVGTDTRRLSPRSIALAILLSCQRTDDTLDELIEQRATSIPQPRDRSLVMELVYGTLRRQETVDWRLDAVLAKPLHRLPMVVQMLLRLGAYQLIRDYFVFTDKRFVLVDKQGITGSKVEYHSIPYKSITHFSIETAGSFDLDAELKIWISGTAAPLQKQFNKKLSNRSSVKVNYLLQKQNNNINNKNWPLI